MTQHNKIIEYMLEHQLQQWFYPPDFMQGGMGDLFVGYEASARLSELASDFPLMIESRRRGKYKERRIRLETINEWWPSLPDGVKQIFVRHGIQPVADFEV